MSEFTCTICGKHVHESTIGAPRPEPATMCSRCEIAGKKERAALQEVARLKAEVAELVEALKHNVRWSGAIAFEPNDTVEGAFALFACDVLVKHGQMRKNGGKFEWTDQQGDKP